MTVLGVVMDAEDARAIVQIAPANEMRRVRIGDDIAGWKVVQIEQRRLVLSLDGNRSATFTMFGGAVQENALPKTPAKHREASPAPAPR